MESFFLKFEGPDIEGGSTTAGYEKQIELLSWSHGFSQPIGGSRSSGEGPTIEQADHQPISVVKDLDSTTPELARICWSGDHIDKAVLTQVVATGGAGQGENLPRLIIEMEDVVINSMSPSGSAGGSVEQMSLSYGKVTYTFGKSDGQGQKKGEIPASHDLRIREIS